MGLSTHVLDTMHGCPAAGMAVELYTTEGEQATLVKRFELNADGRNPDGPLYDNASLKAGTYRLVFDVKGYFASRGVALLDAPVSGGVKRALDGTLSIMVGSDDATMARIRPMLDCCADEVTQCGPVGSGQVVKLMNNPKYAVRWSKVVANQPLRVLAQQLMDASIPYETLSNLAVDRAEAVRAFRERRPPKLTGE